MSSGKILRLSPDFKVPAQSGSPRYPGPAFSLRPLLLTVSSLQNPQARREIKITAKTREEVNFLIGFQSPVLP